LAPDPDAKRRWRQRPIGSVTLGSARGLIAALLIGFSLGLVLVLSLGEAIYLLASKGQTPKQELTLGLLALNLVLNTIVLLVLPVMAVAVSRPHQPGAVARRLGLVVDRRTPLNVFIGIGAAVASLLVLALVVALLVQSGLVSLKDLESDLVPQIQSLLNWPLVFIIALVAAVTEEIFFRGLLQPRLGLIATSILFALIHIGYGTVLQVVAPLVLGLLLGVLYQRTNSLWTPMAAHFTFDFVQLAALLLERKA
jgi:membrane protease YdiL (CAAX protease family)